MEAGAVQSKHFNLKVIDLPAIQKIRVTYHFPAWSGLKDSVEDPGGDVRAVEGTDAEDRRTNRQAAQQRNPDVERRFANPVPSRGGELAHCPSSGPKDGMYHIAAIEQGENVRMSEDFFIEARKDSPPA